MNRSRAWNLVDSELTEAMDSYSQIKTKDGKQSIFLDYIIKINICRVYVLNQNVGKLTARRVLGLADKLIQMVKVSRLHIVTDMKVRLNAPVIGID